MSEPMNKEQYSYIHDTLGEIKKDVRQVHDAIYGNGKSGLATDLAVAKIEIAHLEEKVGETKTESKGVVSFLRDNMAILVIGGIWIVVDLALHLS